MRVRSTHRSRGQLLCASLSLASVVGVSALALTACGHPATATAAGSTIKQCGTARTAANVPVTVLISHGQVSCGTAMTIEHDYAKAIDEGKAPGNGGGGPVPVNGWTCEGFATPEVLKTGNASKCTKDGTEILATLVNPA